MTGGQFYFPDENRYRNSRLVVDKIFSGETKSALSSFNYELHFASRVIGLLPALVEKLTFQDARIPALFFSFFSVLNIYLIWRLSLSFGSSEREALLTAFLFSLSATHFYYARHLFPYDLSMTFFFSALLVSIKKTPSKWQNACLCGTLCAIGFLTYNGYWTLAALTLLIHIFYGPPSWRQMLNRSLLSGVSFILPILLVGALSKVFGGNLQNPITYILEKTVGQGDFSEGGRLPFAYLWHAEHGMLFLWMFSFLYCLWEAGTGNRSKQAAIGIIGVIFIYGVFFIFSVGFQKLVVYGRLVRQLVPFCCLLTAHCLARLRIPGKIMTNHLVNILMILIILQAAINFYRPFTLVFPSDFKEIVQKERRVINILFGSGPWVTLYAYHIYPEPQAAFSLTSRPHQVVLRYPHPLEYLPYQYEGHTADQRRKLRSTDINMRLIVFKSE